MYDYNGNSAYEVPGAPAKQVDCMIRPVPVWKTGISVEAMMEGALPR